MTLGAASPINSYVGTSGANTYAFTFPIFSSQHLTVSIAAPSPSTTKYSLVLGTDYNVTGLNATGDPASTGNIVLISNGQAWLTGGNLTTGYTITIQINVPLEQDASIRNQGDFYQEYIENALDYIVMALQQLNLLITQTVSSGSVTVQSVFIVPIGVTTTPITMVSGKTYLVHTNNGAIQLNLPVPAAGAWFFVKDADQNAHANNMTVHRFGSEKIDGITSDLVISASNACWLITSDGTNWYSIATAADLVLNDISNGHTYRVLMSAGILSTQQVN